MNAYHEVDPDSVESIIEHGLKRTSRGEKGDDSVIKQVDSLLDEQCPAPLRKAGVSRGSNVYAFVEDQGQIIRITDGKKVPIDTFVKTSDQKVLLLSVDPQRCYVSDLDMYDALKGRAENRTIPTKLIQEYWTHVIRLDEYRQNHFRRPEIMITYDIAASDIQLLN